MESIYAALLLHRAEKEISEVNIEKILKAAGAEVDKTQITKLVAGLKEKDINEILKSASAAPMMAAPMLAAGVPGKTEPVEEKKKKKKEEEVDEEPTGIGSLF